MSVKSINKQKGNILVLFTIGLFVLIAMAALALDGSHLLLNKTRLQNVVDAAALHAAKEIEIGKTHDEAREAALDLIKLNLNYPDYNEIKNNIDLTAADFSTAQLSTNIWIDFFDAPEDSTSSPSSTGEYVRVSISNVLLGNFLAQMLSFSKSLGAIAQAGPSSALVECFYDLVPMLVCAPDPLDTTEDAYFGLPLYDPDTPGNDKVYVMKAGAGTESIGPGNFQLIRINDNQGGNDIRKAMAGQSNSNTPQCFIPPSSSEPGGVVPTEPGNTVGPSSQGLNTRFGIYQGGQINSDDHPTDINNCEGSAIMVEEVPDPDNEGKLKFQVDIPENYANEQAVYAEAYMYRDYLSDLANKDDAICHKKENITQSTLSGVANDEINGKIGRRILTVVVGDCTDKTNGASDIPYLGSGCFFLNQSIGKGGQDSYVIGEFLTECGGLGIPSGTTQKGPTFTIVLYRVPGSPDS